MILRFFLTYNNFVVKRYKKWINLRLKKLLIDFSAFQVQYNLQKYLKMYFISSSQLSFTFRFDY